VRNLFLSEIYKIRKSLLFKVLFAFYILSGVLLQAQYMLFGSDLQINTGDDELLEILSGILGEIPKSDNALNGVFFLFYILTILGILSSLCIIPILTSMHISMEYNTRNIQQMVGKGISRIQLIVSKYLIMSGFINGMLFSIAIIGLIINTIIYGTGNVQVYIGDGIIFALKIFLMNMVFMALGTLLAHCFKGSSASMPITFLAVAYIFSSMGEVLISQNSLISFSVFIIMGLFLLGGTVLLFQNSDIN
jgi:ABC-type transport system involved in multi-copper enzyme maturation permease subunit